MKKYIHLTIKHVYIDHYGTPCADVVSDCTGATCTLLCIHGEWTDRDNTGVFYPVIDKFEERATGFILEV